MSVALLVGATSGIAYAATDGATANPFKAVKIYINGEELDAAMQKTVTPTPAPKPKIR